jgi:hypothetical protein
VEHDVASVAADRLTLTRPRQWVERLQQISRWVAWPTAVLAAITVAVGVLRATIESETERLKLERAHVERSTAEVASRTEAQKSENLAREERLRTQVAAGFERSMQESVQALSESVRQQNPGLDLSDISVRLGRHGIDVKVIVDYGYQLVDTALAAYEIGRYTVADVPGGEAALRFLAEVAVPNMRRWTGAVPARARIVGLVDGIPVRDDAFYQGDVGPEVIGSFRSVNEGFLLDSVSLREGDPLDNVLIGFLRAFDVKRWLGANSEFSRVPFELAVETRPEVGPEYRRVRIEVDFPAALRMPDSPRMIPVPVVPK